MQEVEIRDVWAHNLEEELGYIRKLVVDYPMVAMVRACLWRHSLAEKSGASFSSGIIHQEVLTGV